MGLFFDVLSSINNPNQQGSVSQLETLTNTLQNVAGDRGIQPSQLQSVMSVLGGAITPALQQQQRLTGGSQLENMLGQLAGAGAAAGALQTIFPPQLQQQIAQTIAQKTGISANTIQGLLPTLIPAVLGLLNMGASKPGASGANPLLGAFLNGGSSNDLGDVFKFANRFLNPPR